MELDTNLHSVFLLNYHLIMCIKYRREVLDDTVSNRLKEIFRNIGEKYQVTVVEWNHDKDHVHVLFRAEPTTNLSKFINAYKSASSRVIKNEFPDIKQKLWKEFFWSRSYCLCTSGGATIETIKQYIQTQGQNYVGKKRGRKPKQTKSGNEIQGISK